jgi:hypothetical protein
MAVRLSSLLAGRALPAEIFFVEVEVILRLTINQSVCRGVELADSVSVKLQANWRNDLLSGQLTSRVSNWLIGLPAAEFLI